MFVIILLTFLSFTFLVCVYLVRDSKCFSLLWLIRELEMIPFLKKTTLSEYYQIPTVVCFYLSLNCYCTVLLRTVMAFCIMLIMGGLNLTPLFGGIWAHQVINFFAGVCRSKRIEPNYRFSLDKRSQITQFFCVVYLWLFMFGNFLKIIRLQVFSVLRQFGD